MGIVDAYPAKWLPVDTVSGGRIGIDYPHHEIHEGKHFTFSYSKALSAGSVNAVAITTPTAGTGYVHLVAGLQASLSGTFVFSQNASVSGGSALTAWNNDLSSTNTSGTTIVGTPTVTTYGTAISSMVVGSNDNPTNVGGNAESRNEFILATATTYMLYFTANATSTYTSINGAFYVES